MTINNSYNIIEMKNDENKTQFKECMPFTFPSPTTQLRQYIFNAFLLSPPLHTLPSLGH